MKVTRRRLTLADRIKELRERRARQAEELAQTDAKIAALLSQHKAWLESQQAMLEELE